MAKYRLIAGGIFGSDEIKVMTAAERVDRIRSKSIVVVPVLPITTTLALWLRQSRFNFADMASNTLYCID